MMHVRHAAAGLCHQQAPLFKPAVFQATTTTCLTMLSWHMEGEKYILLYAEPQTLCVCINLWPLLRHMRTCICLCLEHVPELDLFESQSVDGQESE